MQVPVHNTSGEVVSQIEISDEVFGVPFNQAVVHQALVRQLANCRLGTADTKTRGEVSGSTKKLYAQKHTGRARRGSVKSPLLRGGGITFGPHPRSYRQAMPKKMRRLALRSVLSDKVKSGDLKIVDRIDIDEPATKAVLDILMALRIGTSVLFSTAGAEPNVVKSARNLPAVKIMPAPLLNVADLISCQALVMTVEAVRKAEELWGTKPVREVTTKAT